MTQIDYRIASMLYNQLKDLEWYDQVPLSDGYPVSCCPDCGKVEFEGHRDDCGLTAALSEYEEWLRGLEQDDSYA